MSWLLWSSNKAVDPIQDLDSASVKANASIENAVLKMPAINIDNYFKKGVKEKPEA